jgi:phosphatidylserine/phosphatidylglycerophosphate/cardiolipin synthase-like enzyme
MVDVPRPAIRPPTPIHKPAPPAPAQAPSMAFASCNSDDTAMLRVPGRNIEDPAYRRRGVRKAEDWFPANPTASVGNQAVTYIQGSCAFSDMADALLTAFAPEHRIYIAGWSTNKDVVLKNGTSTSLEGYLKNTRAQVRGMFYDGQIGISPLLKVSTGVENKWIADAINYLPHGGAIIDGKLPPLGIHHQKLLVVQGQFGLVAFIGGMDIDPSRIEVNSGAGRPWHDTQLRLAGPAALQCRKIFEDRWLDHPGTAVLDQKLGAGATATINERRALAFPPPAALDLQGLPSCTFVTGSKRERRMARVAVGRTFGNIRKSGGSTEYSFAPNGEYTAWALIQQGIKQATRWIYLEDQYMVSRMARTALLDKLRQPGFEFLLILMNGSGAAAPDFRYLVTARNEFRRDLMAVDPTKTRWGMYTLKPAIDPERAKWCGSYLHSKTWIFDDGYVIIGSANCDNRGYTHDTEVAAGIADLNMLDVYLGESIATDLRTRLWHKHLGLPHAQLRDWDKAIKYWKKPPPSAMIADATGFELDADLVPPANFPSPADSASVERLWTKVFDPDSR